MFSTGKLFTVHELIIVKWSNLGNQVYDPEIVGEHGRNREPFMREINAASIAYYSILVFKDKALKTWYMAKVMLGHISYVQLLCRMDLLMQEALKLCTSQSFLV